MATIASGQSLIYFWFEWILRLGIFSCYIYIFDYCLLWLLWRVWGFYIEFLRTWWELCVIISLPSSYANPLKRLGWSANNLVKLIYSMLSVGIVGAYWLKPPCTKIDYSTKKLMCLNLSTLGIFIQSEVSVSYMSRFIDSPTVLFRPPITTKRVPTNNVLCWYL